MATHDWVADISARTRKAYRPDPFAGVLQSLKQGFIGKKIADEELRKKIMTAMLGTHQPMVGEAPATPEQIAAGIKGKPGVVASLFGAKPPEELTWDPIKELTIQEKALKAIEKNTPLPGTTMAETKILAKIKPVKPEKGKVKEPTWGQEQRMASIKSGIERGKVVIGKDFGEPEEFPVKTLVDVLRAIELGGYNPTDPYWQESLAKYPAPKIGEIIDKGGKQYIVVGFDKDGIPLVERVK